MKKQTIELKTFLEELEHNSKIPNTTHIDIEYVIERIKDILNEDIELFGFEGELIDKIDSSKETKINNDSDYFFWLGQVSAFICNIVPNERIRRNMVQESLINTNYDINMISIIKRHLNYASAFIPLNTDDSNRFENIFVNVLAYKADLVNPLSDRQFDFLRGFYSKTKF